MSERTTLGWWEFPALTRNSDVKEIIQVDPRAADDKGHVIWTPQDGPTDDEPRG